MERLPWNDNGVCHVIADVDAETTRDLVHKTAWYLYSAWSSFFVKLEYATMERSNSNYHLHCRRCFGLQAQLSLRDGSYLPRNIQDDLSVSRVPRHSHLEVL